jgi:hypothetical protein
MKLSNKYEDLKEVADRMDVMPSSVLMAKEQTGSDDINVIEEWIICNISHPEDYEVRTGQVG